jgi:ribonuclease D
MAGVGGHSRLTVTRDDLPAEFLTLFCDAPLVAWDIETSGLDWLDAQIGTCQLFSETAGVVVIGIDPAVRPARLISLLEDGAVPKVFHHAPFDLRFMIHEWSARPAAIRCTKVASKLIAPDAPNEAHSLQQLLSRYVGVDMAKGAVRTSDWTAAQLTREQIEYAAGDVIHLPALLRALMGELASLKRTWLYDLCCDFLPARASLELGGYPDVFGY